MHMIHDDSDIYSFSIPSCSDVQDALACAVFPENLQPVCVQNVQPVCRMCAAATFTLCHCCQWLLQRSMWLCDWFSVHRWPAICERIVTLKLPCEDIHQLLDSSFFKILPIWNRVRHYNQQKIHPWVRLCKNMIFWPIMVVLWDNDAAETFTRKNLLLSAHGMTCGLHSTLLYSFLWPVKKLEKCWTEFCWKCVAKREKQTHTVIVYNVHIKMTHLQDKYLELQIH